MRLGFYYHYAVLFKEGKPFLPGFLGVFVDALADRVNELILFAHVTNSDPAGLYDYQLSTKIRIVQMLPRHSAWYRHFFHAKFLKPIQNELNQCDLILLRSPSPLVPFFQAYCTSVKLVYLVVGDYALSAREKKINSWRDRLVLAFNLHHDRLFRKSMRSTDIVVNSPALFRTYAPIAKSCQQVRTTTLRASDFFQREDATEQSVHSILFTGRITPEKGLFELMQGFCGLANLYPDLQLHIVGWEADARQPVQTKLMQEAESEHLADRIFFHGKKAIGPDLNAMYRKASIYVMPSYHEGFPRTIWEAMANGLPVVATRVGAIPDYLTDEVDALLIDPRQVHQIQEAIQRICNEPELRKKLIRNGYALARENTLEKQTDRLLNCLQQVMKSEH